jgi:formylglycine-generating enzyme required for sulfatase activity
MSCSKEDLLFTIRLFLITGLLMLSILIGQDAAFQQGDLASEPNSSNQRKKMVFIPAGSFIMGSDEGRSDEAPAHRVYLDAFWIDQYEVTNKEYLDFILETNTLPPSYWQDGQYPPGQDLYPVVGVRWKDAQLYCQWAGKRLPTEAEWEKACRGTTGQIYPWGNLPGNNRGNVTSLPEGPQPGMWEDAWDLLTTPSPKDLPAIKPVGSYPCGVSPYGIHDLIGNASEWVADYYNWDGYWVVSNRNPLVVEPPWNHVVRGSAWLMPYGSLLGGHDSNRCAARSSSHGDTSDARIGIRCARSGNK